MKKPGHSRRHRRARPKRPAPDAGPSLGYYEWRTCLGKRRYESEAEAQDGNSYWRVYHCPVCGGYHRASPRGKGLK